VDCPASRKALGVDEMDGKRTAAVIITYADKDTQDKIKSFFETEEELTLLEMDVLKRDIKHSLLRIKTVRNEQAARRKAKDVTGKAV
jgi:enoyl-[acyl-carrier-protein] reductase (NADH)